MLERRGVRLCARVWYGWHVCLMCVRVPLAGRIASPADNRVWIAARFASVARSIRFQGYASQVVVVCVHTDKVISVPEVKLLFSLSVPPNGFRRGPSGTRVGRFCIVCGIHCLYSEGAVGEIWPYDYGPTSRQRTHGGGRSLHRQVLTRVLASCCTYHVLLRTVY